MKETLVIGFSGILDTGSVEDRKMMKNKKIAGIINRFRGQLVKMLVVDLMIIPFFLKLDKFYCIGFIN